MAKKGSAVKSGGRRAGISSKVKLRAEDELEITVEFLRLVNEARSTDELVRAAATFFQQKSGCEVLGIRLKQGEDYPYYIARGFSPEFLERENHLCARSKDGKTLYDREGFPIYECVCGNVVCGRFNPSKPFYSAKGSFWTNSTSELVTVATEEDLMAKIRGRCVENFESVAVICIRQGEETLGLLHINDRRKGMFSPEIITRWERLADQLAVALAKFRAEDELRKARDTLEATVEQRTAELHKSESLLAKSQEMAHIGSWELDVKTGDINRSTESYRIFGAALDGPKIDYGDFISFIVPGDRERVDALIKSSLETGQPYTVTYDIKRKDGQVRTIMSHGETVCDGSGQSVRMYDTNQDITERKRTEEALKSSETMLKLVMDNTPQCIFWKDINSVYLGCNSAFARLTGVGTSEHIIGKTDYDLSFTKEQADSFRGYDRQVMSTGLPVYHILETFKDANGRQGWADTNKVPLFDSEGNVIGVIGTYEDITERRRVEEALRESEERLRVAALAAGIGVWSWIPGTSHVIVSANWRHIFGVTRDAEVTFETWRDSLHPDDREGAVNELNAASEQHREFNIDYRVVWPDGTIRWIVDRGRASYDESGHAIGMAGVNVDITERKQMEEELANAKAQAELYLDLMGHDINNMHQIALGYLELARDMSPDAGKQEFLDKPIEVLQRSARLIQNVRKLQKLQEGLFRTEKVDVREVLDSVQREFGAVPNKAVTLNLNGCEQCHVRANELLHDVFANLVSNAIKHTGDRADIVVDLDVVWNDGRQYCRVMVEDDGPGIPDDFKGRIFNRLLKGTEKATGMGLGLYLVKSLVESYGGRVWVEDRIAGDHTKGARFVVMLPAAEK